jgi:hypothetical protein
MWHILIPVVTGSRSQWPSSLRYELSSLAPTLGSWVQIPFKAFMFVCVSSVFVLSCVGSRLATGLITRQRSPTDCVQH